MARYRFFVPAEVAHDQSITGNGGGHLVQIDEEFESAAAMKTAHRLYQEYGDHLSVTVDGKKVSIDEPLAFA